MAISAPCLSQTSPVGCPGSTAAAAAVEEPGGKDGRDLFQTVPREKPLPTSSTLYARSVASGLWPRESGSQGSVVFARQMRGGPGASPTFGFGGPLDQLFFFFEVDGVQFESVAVYLILEAKINQGNRNPLRKYEHTSGPRKPPTSSQGALTPRPKNWRSL